MSFMDEHQHGDFIRNYKKFQEQFDNLYWKKIPNWYLVFKENEDEEFKSIEEYQGFYFISNYGKVISFKRKLPGVRQTSMMNGFRTVTLNHFKSIKLHFIHDLVYTYFVGPIELQHRVAHLDNNPENNYYKNLQLIDIPEIPGKPGIPGETESDLSQEAPTPPAPLLTGVTGEETPGPEVTGIAIKPGRRGKSKTAAKISRETRQTQKNRSKKIGLPKKLEYPKNLERPKKLGRPRKSPEAPPKKGKHDFGVLQFDLAGKLAREFSSLREAAKTIGIDSQLIMDCLKGESKTAGDFQWRYSTDPNFDDGIFEIGPVKNAGKPPASPQVSGVFREKEKPGKRKPVSHRALPVFQYEKNGKFVREYASITAAAAAIGVTPAAIGFVINNPHRTAGGFTWKKKNK